MRERQRKCETQSASVWPPVPTLIRSAREVSFASVRACAASVCACRAPAARSTHAASAEEGLSAGSSTSGRPADHDGGGSNIVDEDEDEEEDEDEGEDEEGEEEADESTVGAAATSREGIGGVLARSR